MEGRRSKVLERREVSVGVRGLKTSLHKTMISTLHAIVISLILLEASPGTRSLSPSDTHPSRGVCKWTSPIVTLVLK